MKTIYNTLHTIFAICLIFALASLAQAQSKPFQAIDIGAVTELGGVSNSTPVRAVGQRNGRGFIFSEGQTTPRTLELVPGDPSTTGANATAISSDGDEAVGVDRSQPTDWPNPVGPSNPGHFPTPVGCIDLGVPVALNDSRVAVGACASGVEAGTSKPLRWAANGSLTVADLPAGFFGGKAMDVNNAGTIVGQIVNAEGTKLAAIWTNPSQAPITIGIPEARGISNGSVLTNSPDLITMIGQFPDPAGFPHQRGWTWMFINGGLGLISTTRIPFVPIYVPPSYPSYYLYLLQPFTAAETHRINGSGTSVGFAKRNNGATVATLWNLGGQVADLAFNTSGLPIGTVLTDAVDINDQGYVLVKGLVNGDLHGFLLKPTGVAIAFSAGY